MYYVHSLIKKISQIQNALPAEIASNSSFRDRVILAHRDWVVSQLNGILSRASTEDVTASINDSKLNDFKLNLNKQLALELKDFLTQNWLLINGSCLSYTALQDDLTFLLFNIAKDIRDFIHQNEEKSLSLIQILMPSISLESLQPTIYPHLICNSIEELKVLLKKTVLGKDGLYLIPGNLLLTLNEDAPDDFFKNYFFDFEKHPADSAFLDESEVKKLVLQSKEAEAYYNAVMEYNKLITEEDNLYSRLEILWKHLYYNSKNILGKEDICGEGVYTHILNFINYYDALEEYEQDIPNSIKLEINQLKEAASVQSGLKACLAMRQESLRKTIQENKDILKSIPKTQENNTLSKEHLNNMKEDFFNALKDSAYECKEELGLTKQLIKNLNIPINLDSPKSFFEFITLLTPGEIKSFGLDSSIKQTIISAIPNLEELVILITTGLSNLQLESFAHYILEGLINPTDPKALVKNAQDLTALFLFLDDKKLEIFLHCLQNKLPTLIQSSSLFVQVIRPFSGNQFHLLCKAFEPHLPQLIKNQKDLRNILENLNYDQCAFICEEWRGHFFKFVQNGADFNFIACLLNKNQRKILYESFKDQFSIIVNSGKDFHDVLTFLELAQRVEIYKQLKPLFPKLIQSAEDFYHILFELPEEERTAIYLSFKKKFPKLIRSAANFSDICKFLKKNQQAEIFDSSKKYLPDLIKNSNDFFLIFIELNQEQRAFMYNSFKANLPNIINSAWDFKYILDSLNKTQKEDIYQIVKDRIPHFIKTADDLYLILSTLQPEQCTAVYETLKIYIPDLLQNPTDFKVLNFLDESQCLEICRALKTQLIQIIQNPYRFRQIFNPLEAQPSSIICELVKNQCAEIFPSLDKLNVVVRFLNPFQRSIIYKTFKEHIPTLINTENDLSKISYFYKSEQEEIIKIFREQQSSFSFFKNQQISIKEPLNLHKRSQAHYKGI